MNTKRAKEAKKKEIDVELVRGMSMDENTLSNQIIGAAIEVHKHMGPGLLENIYQSAMECELSLRQIPFECQKQLPVVYKGKTLDLKYQLDLLVGGLVIVELKSVDRLSAVHEAQVITYLKLTGCKLGLLLNFNVAQMQQGVKRVVLGLSPARPFPGQRISR